MHVKMDTVSISIANILMSYE